MKELWVLLVACVAVGLGQVLDGFIAPGRCFLPPDPGNCGGRTREKWFYSAEAKQCRQFGYTGCEGNGNNFDTFEDCLRVCTGIAGSALEESKDASIENQAQSPSDHNSQPEANVQESINENANKASETAATASEGTESAEILSEGTEPAGAQEEQRGPIAMESAMGTEAEQGPSNEIVTEEEDEPLESENAEEVEEENEFDVPLNTINKIDQDESFVFQKSGLDQHDMSTLQEVMSQYYVSALQAKEIDEDTHQDESLPPSEEGESMGEGISSSGDDEYKDAEHLDTPHLQQNDLPLESDSYGKIPLSQYEHDENNEEDVEDEYADIRSVISSLSKDHRYSFMEDGIDETDMSTLQELMSQMYTRAMTDEDDEDASNQHPEDVKEPENKLTRFVSQNGDAEDNKINEHQEMETPTNDEPKTVLQNENEDDNDDDEDEWGGTLSSIDKIDLDPNFFFQKGPITPEDLNTLQELVFQMETSALRMEEELEEEPHPLSFLPDADPNHLKQTQETDSDKSELPIVSAIGMHSNNVKPEEESMGTGPPQDDVYTTRSPFQPIVTSTRQVPFRNKKAPTDLPQKGTTTHQSEPVTDSHLKPTASSSVNINTGRESANAPASRILHPDHTKKPTPPECMLPPDRGPCRALKLSWFFDPEKGCCNQFEYGGCHGNKNRFDSKKSCMRHCKGAVEPIFGFSPRQFPSQHHMKKIQMIGKQPQQAQTITMLVPSVHRGEEEGLKPPFNPPWVNPRVPVQEPARPPPPPPAVMFSKIMKTMEFLPKGGLGHILSQKLGNMGLPPKELVKDIIEKKFGGMNADSLKSIFTNGFHNKDEGSQPMVLLPHLRKWPMLRVFMAKVSPNKLFSNPEIQQQPQFERPESEINDQLRNERDNLFTEHHFSDLKPEDGLRRKFGNDEGFRRGRSRPFRDPQSERRKKPGHDWDLDDDENKDTFGKNWNSFKKGYKGGKQMDFTKFETNHMNNLSPKNKFTLLQVFVNKKPHNYSPEVMQQPNHNFSPKQMQPQMNPFPQPGPVYAQHHHEYPYHAPMRLPTIPPYHPRIGPNLYLNYHPFFPHLSPTLSNHPPWRTHYFSNGPQKIDPNAQGSREPENQVIINIEDHEAVGEPNYACMLPLNTGMCKTFQVKWYFNKFKQRCELFFFGGCGGNANRFDSMQECHDTCMVISPKPESYAYNPTEPVSNYGEPNDLEPQDQADRLPVINEELAQDMIQKEADRRGPDDVLVITSPVYVGDNEELVQTTPPTSVENKVKVEPETAKCKEDYSQESNSQDEVEEAEANIVAGLHAQGSTEYILIIVIMCVVGLAVVLLVAITVAHFLKKMNTSKKDRVLEAVLKSHLYGDAPKMVYTAQPPSHPADVHQPTPQSA